MTSINDEKKADLEEQGIPANMKPVYMESALNPIYQAKVELLNDALQEIGMGKYQWYLFIVTGFGWFSDNLWPVVIGLILVPVIAEFHFNGPYIKLGAAIGVLVGAVFWGVGCDIWGRKLSFNLTILMTGIFAVAAGGSPNWIALTSFCTLLSVGVGGNLPVDSAVFLEFIPATHQYLLTVLSIWWAWGQFVGSLVAWPLLGNYSCSLTAAVCTRSENMGWRYFMFAMGGLLLFLGFIRVFLFDLYEPPKYLVGRGRDEEAVLVIHKIAKYNGVTCSLTLEQLQKVGTMPGYSAADKAAILLRSSTWQAVKTKMSEIRKSFFATKKLAWSTTLLLILWSFIGLAFPLYSSFVTYFLASRGATFGDGSTYITYRNQAIISVVGLPGAIFAGWLVELPYLGRRGTLAVSTIVTGVFLFASTTARSSNALLGWICGYTFTSNIMYGVLYAMSPELFPTKDRGTGNAMVAAANRIFGILAPVIALITSLTSSIPIYISAALFVVSGLLAFLLPFEPRGQASF